MNKHFNVTISTDIKKLEGDEGIDEEVDEEQEENMQTNDDISNIANELEKRENDAVFKKINNDSDEDEHEIDENKFTPMMYDESEFLIINNTKLQKIGTMDDVYIFEKVHKDEIDSILFIQSCVPQIKEFLFNLRFN